MKRRDGKLVLKGIQDTEDARTAVASGADALVVSNHGGSQIEVHMDAGTRSGQDVLKAQLWVLVAPTSAAPFVRSGGHGRNTHEQRLANTLTCLNIGNHPGF